MTATQTPEVSQQTEHRSITDRTVCIQMQINGIGNSKKVPVQKIERIEGESSEGPADYVTGVQDENTAKVDRSLLRMSKQLLDSPELKAIKKLDGQIRAYVYSQCLPYRVGIYLLPNELVTKVDEELQSLAKKREELVDKFIAAYPEQIEASMKRLYSLGDRGDYKTIDQVRQAFSFDWQYINFGVPDKLRDISPDFFQREQQKAAQKWAEANDAVQQVLRAQMSELVEKLQDKLTPNPDGTPKRFQKSTVENVRSFLETFDLRNVTNDEELGDLVDSARAALAGFTADDLRSNEAIRDGLRGSFEKIKKDLDTMTVAEGRRMITFEEDEE